MKYISEYGCSKSYDWTNFLLQCSTFRKRSQVQATELSEKFLPFQVNAVGAQWYPFSNMLFLHFTSKREKLVWPENTKLINCCEFLQKLSYSLSSRNGDNSIEDIHQTMHNCRINDLWLCVLMFTIFQQFIPNQRYKCKWFLFNNWIVLIFSLFYVLFCYIWYPCIIEKF